MNSQFSQPPPYIGRFAPSPTGPLHFGSLVTALASFLDARANKGKWLVRIEDIDPPREQPGADKLILETLETHGLEWDSSVLYQSSRLAAYEDIIDFLFDQGQVYCCDCSRQQLKNHPIYPGTCRHRRLKRRDNFAVRIMVPPQRIQFDDEIQGVQAQQMEQEVGDFVVFRRDGLVAYQLAVATDDAFQHISKVVRGQDLLSSTSRQCYLFKTLSINPPEYAHVPIITNIQGQ
ncbi:MAG: tRNA glutamyl-Q(34) synthetase GluQRS, partial [Pseudomonadales bacterium]|nr:tRNA glutamyl-Q(34) synthetase GluQRS [Pseudomonadales bacterium]